MKNNVPPGAWHLVIFIIQCVCLDYSQMKSVLTTTTTTTTTTTPTTTTPIIIIIIIIIIIAEIKNGTTTTKKCYRGIVHKSNVRRNRYSYVVVQ